MSADQKNIVFYADDDSDDLQLVEEAFSKFSSNIELETAYDGIEAISSLQEMTRNGIKPCLIILDINMPRLDGRETLVRIRQMQYFDNTPVIFFSTSSQPAESDFAMRYNAGFIVKPIDHKHLEAIVNTFIDHCENGIQEVVRLKAK